MLTGKLLPVKPFVCLPKLVLLKPGRSTLLNGKKAKTSLPADYVPAIQIGKRKVVFLVKKGLKNFRYINPKVEEDDNLALIVSAEDVNWAVNSYEGAKKAFYTSKWMQYAPMAIFAIAVIGIIVLLFVLFKNFDVIKEAAIALEGATKNQAVAKATLV